MTSWNDDVWRKGADSWSDEDTPMDGNGMAKGTRRERKGGMKLGKARGSPLVTSDHINDRDFSSLPAADLEVL